MKRSENGTNVNMCTHIFFASTKCITRDSSDKSVQIVHVLLICIHAFDWCTYSWFVHMLLVHVLMAGTYSLIVHADGTCSSSARRKHDVSWCRHSAISNSTTSHQHRRRWRRQITTVVPRIYQPPSNLTRPTVSVQYITDIEAVGSDVHERIVYLLLLISSKTFRCKRSTLHAAFT